MDFPRSSVEPDILASPKAHGEGAELLSRLIARNFPGQHGGHGRQRVRQSEFTMAFSDGREFEVNYWVRFGDPHKTAVVILPGLDEQAISWRKVITRFLYRSNLAPITELSDRTVVIINQRGQGPTRENELRRYGSAPRLVRRSDQIEILRAVLEQLELQDVIMVGHSYGGSTVLGALGEDDLRARMRSLVLLAPHVSQFERFTTDFSQLMRVRAAAWLELLNPYAYKLGTVAYLPMFFNQALREGNLCPYTREWTDERIAFLSAMTMGVMKVDTARDISVLEDDPRPVHLMIAENDRLVPVGAHQYLYQLLPTQAKGRLIRPDGTTHRLHQKAREEVAHLLAEVARESDEAVAFETLPRGWMSLPQLISR